LTGIFIKQHCGPAKIGVLENDTETPALMINLENNLASRVYKNETLRKTLRKFQKHLLSSSTWPPPEEKSELINSNVIIFPPPFRLRTPFILEEKSGTGLKEELKRYIERICELKSSLNKKVLIACCLPADFFRTSKNQIIREVLKEANIDIATISGMESVANNQRRLVEILVNARKTIPADIAIHASVISLPTHAPLLVYMGVDILDCAYPLIAAAYDVYLHERGELPLQNMTVLSCTCPICSKYDSVSELKNLPPDARFEILSAHNLIMLLKIINETRDAIKRKTIWELLENHVYSLPVTTAAMRHLLLSHQEFLEKYTPVVTSRRVICTSALSYYRPEVVRFRERVKERYMPPSNVALVILLPCSARKPYSKSRTHKMFREAIKCGAGPKFHLIHEVIITSPLGIVPRELEMTFPAAHYDVPVTGHWDREEMEIAISALVNYFQKIGGKIGIIAHVENAYKEIVEEAISQLGLEAIFTVKNSESVTSPSALKRLETTVREMLEGHELKGGDAKDRLVQDYRKIAEYQFGADVAIDLINETSVFREEGNRGVRVLTEGKFVAFLEYATGLYKLSLHGAEVLLLKNKYCVFVKDIPRTEDITADTVIRACNEIRPHDEVAIILDKTVIGIGQANMCGQEMEEASKGVAVKLRLMKPNIKSRQ